MQKIISCFIIIALLTQSHIAAAQFTPPNSMAAVSVREFYVGRDLGKPLITVHLLNGVNSPGVYHIPIDTDVAQLIAYAGGANPTADLSEITVRRGARGNYSITNLNLEKALKQPTDLFRMQDHDVIQIDQQFSAEKPLQWVGIISAIASVALSVFLVQDIQRRGN